MIKIGTRGSKLALWQAHDLQDQLTKIGIESELIIIKTKGDQIQDIGFDKIEGKGFFTKEIEDSLLAADIDIAVHSMKDLPTEMPAGLVIGGLSTRANPADLLIINQSAVDESRILKLKKAAVVGTSSIRRKVQIAHFDQEADIKDVRGNVPTRIQKMESGEYDAIVLAAAGVERLGIDLSAHKVVAFNPKEFVSAPAQGVVAYQCKKEDKQTRKILKSIHQSATAKCTNVERKVLNLMDGGCQLPLGVYCIEDERGNLHCYACYSPGAGQALIHTSLSQSTHLGMAETIVEQLNKG